MADGTLNGTNYWWRGRKYNGNYTTTKVTSSTSQPERPSRSISGVSSWTGGGVYGCASKSPLIVGADTGYYTTYNGYTANGNGTYTHSFNNSISWEEDVALIKWDISSISNTPVTINLKFTVANNVDSSNQNSNGFYISAPPANIITKIKNSNTTLADFQSATDVKNSGSTWPKQTVAISTLTSTGAKIIALDAAVINVLKTNGGYLYFTEAGTTNTDPPSVKSFFAKTNLGTTVSDIKLEYTITTSACTAPTAVKWAQSAASLSNKTSGICMGGSNAIVISWSGAGGGTNNAISSYEIYYNAGSTPTTSSTKLTSSSTSVTIPAATVNGLTRGTKYYIGVIAVGAAGQSYKSPMSTVSCYFQVNKLPSAPTVTTPTYTSSTATTFTYSTTAGTDSDGQNYTVKYTIGTGTTYYDAGTSMSFSTSTTSQTYKFWTYDGLEYSSSSTNKTVTRNTPPTISSVTMTGLAPNTGTSNGTVITQIKLDCAYTAGTQTTSGYTYSWKLKKGTSTSAITTATSAIGTTKTITSYNVNGAGITFGNYYKATVTINDGVESVSLDSTNYFFVPKAPTSISAVYNQFADSNVSTANEAHFYNRLRVKFAVTWNANMVYDVKLGANGSFTSPISTSSHTQSGSGSAGYVDATFSYNSLKYNQSYTIKLVYSVGNISGEITYGTAKTTCTNYTPTFESITPQGGSTGGSIFPYTMNTFNVVISGQPLGFTVANDMQTTNTANYQWYIVYNNTSYGITINTMSGSNGTYNFTLNLPKTMPVGGVTKSTVNELWQAILGTSKYPYSLYSSGIEVRCDIINQFGAVFTNKTTLKTDFRNGPFTFSLTTAYLNTSSTYSNWTATTGHIFEGTTLKLTGSFKTYTNATPTTVTFSSNKFTLGNSTSYSSDIDTNQDTHLITYTWTYTYTFVIPIITTEAQATFTLTVNAGGSTVSSSAITRGYFKRFVPGDTDIIIKNITSTSTTSGSNIIYTYNFTLDGSSVGAKQLDAITGGTYSSIAWKIQCSTDGTSFTNLSGASGTLNSSSNPKIITEITPSGTRTLAASAVDAENLFFRLVLTYTKNTSNVKYASSPSTAKQSYTWTQSANNAYRFFNLAPTISYGKNNLYINTNKAPTNSSGSEILVIRPHNARNVIYIGADGKEAIINLSNENQITIDKFYIDGGTW